MMITDNDAKYSSATVSKGTNDFLQGKSNQYYANLTNILTVKHDRYTPEVYKD